MAGGVLDLAEIGAVSPALRLSSDRSPFRTEREEPAAGSGIGVVRHAARSGTWLAK
jgi:hypothetical protein